MVAYREQYRPLTQRTMETYQTQYLARKFDFTKESRIARMIVQSVNEMMDREEHALAIERVKPFELYIDHSNRSLRLPLFKPEYLEPLYRGETFASARRYIRTTCLKRLRLILPSATESDLLRFIDPWALCRRTGPVRYSDTLLQTPIPYDEQASAEWKRMIDAIQPPSIEARMSTPDVSAPVSQIHALAGQIASETGLGMRVCRHLVEELILLRNICCPRTNQLISGQMPLVVTHVRAHLSEETATEFRRHTPVVVSVWSPGEKKSRPENTGACLQVLKKRMVRVCFEAYRQNGLLSLQELQWIFQISTARISELLRSVQQEAHIIVPTPGTVLDAGKSLTHKDIIVRLHLQGYDVKEICRMTYHSPKAVDNYIGTFEAVLILKLYQVAPVLMARILNKGPSLVQEYLELIDQYYPDVHQIKHFLQKKGVNI